jgi:hypothetical protein
MGPRRLRKQNRYLAFPSRQRYYFASRASGYYGFSRIVGFAGATNRKEVALIRQLALGRKKTGYLLRFSLKFTDREPAARIEYDLEQ